MGITTEKHVENLLSFLVKSATVLIGGLEKAFLPQAILHQILKKVDSKPSSKLSPYPHSSSSSSLFI